MKYSGALAAILLGLCFGGEGRAEDPAPEVVQEILQVLHERGMMSEDRYEQLAGRYVSEASFGYFEVEANAFPAFFIDSDLLDNRSNRRG